MHSMHSVQSALLQCRAKHNFVRVYIRCERADATVCAIWVALVGRAPLINSLCEAPSRRRKLIFQRVAKRKCLAPRGEFILHSVGAEKNGCFNIHGLVMFEIGLLLARPAVTLNFKVPSLKIA